ncbi:hypothetical protein JANAI62_17860 [Jannaschia pagri]|uniref:Cytochrome c domain-containing protein n=1 Tax=Jannaschia pagri TaxID=2829797 RepID=A0ABQ4NL73_9RHOB|nr:MULTISPECIES: cytochrome c [unclassified Jannaschia]GIT91330.1 hypothetical protein JANAI61_17880 [Jannaschia sp. AI_61]GIT95163.1 hypothetical protein JANAI62_17860 [Jannaschia sp. AI_62]
MIRLFLALLVLPLTATAGEVRLYAPDALVDTGLIRHILPRFTLKTQVRVALVPQAEAQVMLGPDGRPLWQGAGATWHLAVPGEGDDVDRFVTWLRSDVGTNTVTSFAPDGAALFTLAEAGDDGQDAVVYAGDVALGHAVSVEKCARCHAVEAGKSLGDIGSTPSFALLRALPNWEERFVTFYVLKPHGAFTQIIDLTEPFPADRPSPIVPIALTLDEVDAVTAYVAGMAPADLGAPLAHQ